MMNLAVFFAAMMQHPDWDSLFHDWLAQCEVVSLGVNPDDRADDLIALVPSTDAARSDGAVIYIHVEQRRFLFVENGVEYDLKQFHSNFDWDLALNIAMGHVTHLSIDGVDDPTADLYFGDLINEG